MNLLHKINKRIHKRQYQTCVKMLMLFACVCVMLFSKGEISAKAASDDVITTHIWATTYNNTNHWEYCTLCGETRNVSAHSFTDHWLYGSESCNDTNYSTRICSCGYNYTYRKPHGNTSQWKGITNRLLHYNNCVDCGRWRQSERCYNYDARGQKQFLSCKNPGTCVVCGSKPKKEMHFMIKGSGYGKCRDCGVNLFKMSNYTVEYAPDYSTATIQFTWTPVYEGFELTGSMGAYQDVSIFSSVVWTHKRGEDGSVTYTGVYTFHRDRQVKCNLNFVDRQDVGRINGINIYANGGFYSFPLWQDHNAPTVDSIDQSDQLMHDSWATIKQLDIKGSEALAKIVTLSIIDKESGQIVIDKAKVPVVDGKYNYVCTPPLEGPEFGREYILRVTDEYGNVLNHSFMIYKTDSKPPVLESATDYVQWSQTKNITLDISDYGAAGVQTSLGNQTSYINAPYVSKNLYRLAYKFKEDNYGVTAHNLYMRDGLGNATKIVFNVGKVDNTKPTVTDIKIEETDESATLTVTAHDRNEVLNAEGSGIVGYALTSDVEIPQASEWQTSNVITTRKTGRLYLWVKDLAGNIADVRKINISESYIVDIKDDDIVIYDKGKKKIDSEDKDIGDVKESSNKEDVYDADKLDATPKTGDYKYIYMWLYVGLATFSSIILIIMEYNRKRVFRKIE